MVGGRATAGSVGGVDGSVGGVDGKSNVPMACDMGLATLTTDRPQGL